jgi:hypothetical protein
MSLILMFAPVLQNGAGAGSDAGSDAGSGAGVGAG